MMEDLLVQRMREAMREWDALPAQERFDELVRRGVIDEQGNVLKRLPEPPPKEKKPRQKKKRTEADS